VTATSADAEVRCDKAVLTTLDSKPRCSVGAESASHQANQWRFGKRTAVAIDQAHQELVNAMAKRLK
jgi:hypothetical protein